MIFSDESDFENIFIDILREVKIRVHVLITGREAWGACEANDCGKLVSSAYAKCHDLSLSNT
jgi:hypothetical protein